MDPLRLARRLTPWRPLHPIVTGQLTCTWDALPAAVSALPEPFQHRARRAAVAALGGHAAAHWLLCLAAVLALADASVIGALFALAVVSKATVTGLWATMGWRIPYAAELAAGAVWGSTAVVLVSVPAGVAACAAAAVYTTGLLAATTTPGVPVGPANRSGIRP